MFQKKSMHSQAGHYTRVFANYRSLIYVCKLHVLYIYIVYFIKIFLQKTIDLFFLSTALFFKPHV